jgi:hypothetical protein
MWGICLSPAEVQVINREHKGLPQRRGKHLPLLSS